MDRRTLPLNAEDAKIYRAWMSKVAAIYGAILVLGAGFLIYLALNRPGDIVNVAPIGQNLLLPTPL